MINELERHILKQRNELAEILNKVVSSYLRNEKNIDPVILSKASEIIKKYPHVNSK
ncbi:hypothetical protein SAMN05216522_11317 [Rosenbergiella nectarea]|uniref:Transcriptional regulator n=1 Tax=Rosenbergiella nectarea TaxID=988801 RepID=A0A1H9M0K3_9GAMM|nr:hypothetical protein SAMN05216522_11317 [Rosenbergiella nectarea]